jgi:hypothetical protein
MKLNYCTECGDIYTLSCHRKMCRCGGTYGYYTDDGLTAVIGGPHVIPLGFANNSFFTAIKSRPVIAGPGRDFVAFVIPEKCDHIIEDNSETPYQRLLQAARRVTYYDCSDDDQDFQRDVEFLRVALAGIEEADQG